MNHSSMNNPAAGTPVASDPKAFRRLPISHPLLMGNEKAYVNECLDTTWISSVGGFITRFEERFANFCGSQYAVACNNGTSALHLALLAAKIQPGDEVIVPTLTYVAAANAVRYCNATPVFVDSEPLTMNLDPAALGAKITPRTKAIIAVHLYGHPADMDPILEIARRHGLLVIEDAAEAHGALYRERMVGAIGDMAVFSFFGNKIITTGEGGMLTTNDAEIEKHVRLLRGQGMDPEKRYWFPAVGYNYRMTNIQAALGLAQLENVGTHLGKRRKVAEWYQQYLAELSPWLILPAEMPWARHAFWMYTVIMRDCWQLDRDTLMSCLAESGIETRPVFYPMHVMPVYTEHAGAYPTAERLGRRGLNLPTHGLIEEDDVKFIAQRIRALCQA